jgi:cytochrome c553
MLGSILCFGLAGPFAAAEENEPENFLEKLDRVNAALRTNPAGVSVVALESCEKRRRFAAKLYQQSYTTRAERSLAYCFDVLHIPRTAPRPPRPKGPDLKAIAAQSALEVETALALEPNLDNGLEVYRDCALCHMPEGWGMKSGLVPQLAGQHKEVIIKQLADIRAGNREAHLMLPYASVDAIGGPQAVADVAAYIDTLEISTDVGKGPGENLDVGETLYAANCAVCHGDQGQGDPATYAPRIQSQHFKYLVRQFELIRDGKRKNANPEMQTLIKNLDQEQTTVLLDYISRLEPPEEMQAPPGWFNPDFEAPPEPLAGVRPPR